MFGDRRTHRRRIRPSVHDRCASADPTLAVLAQVVTVEEQQNHCEPGKSGFRHGSGFFRDHARCAPSPPPESFISRGPITRCASTPSGIVSRLTRIRS